MAARYNGDASRFRAGSAATVARALGVRAGTLAGAARRAFEELAPVLALVPGLGRWTVAEKRDLIRIVRAKAGSAESNYLRLLRRHRRLRDAVVRLGSAAPGSGRRS
jgi:hypothetical protein